MEDSLELMAGHSSAVVHNSALEVRCSILVGEGRHAAALAQENKTSQAVNLEYHLIVQKELTQGAIPGSTRKS